MMVVLIDIAMEVVTTIEVLLQAVVTIHDT